MAIAFVRDATSTTDTLTVPAAGFAAGNLVVMGGAWDDATSTVSGITDTTGVNVWAQAAISQGAGRTCNLWYSVLTNALVSGNTIVAALAANDGIWIAAEFSGIATSPLDQHPTGTQDVTTTSHSSGTTGTTVQADELLVGLFFNFGTQPYTATGAFILNENLNAFSSFELGMVYQIVAATGTYTATASTVGNASSNNLIATFKASGAAPPPAGDTDTRRYQIRRSRMTSW